MEVHAHTHTSRKKWTHYLWEFLMLFLAVTLGFVVENIREQYIESHRAHELVIPLVQDIRQDTASLNTLINLRKDQSKILDTIKTIMEVNEWKLGSRKLYSLYRRYIRRQEFQNRNTTIDQLKNSGYLRYFKDQKLVFLLQQYVIDMQLVKDRQSRELNIMDKAIDETSRKYFDQFAMTLLNSETAKESDFMIRNLSQFNKDDFINDLEFLNAIRRNNNIIYNTPALESGHKLLDRLILDFPKEAKKEAVKN